MTNRHGTPIWYELQTTDAAGSKAFYDGVMGWTVGGPPESGMDYRMIGTADGGRVGGLMPLTAEMQAGGGKPGWLFYIGVDDVDATVQTIEANGGSVGFGPFDIPGAGRAALVADPGGNRFYIMRGSTPEVSDAWNRERVGRCSWNELEAPDQAAANAFYAAVFGWSYPDRMTMPGDMGDYVFVEANGETIGATMQRGMVGEPNGWQFYFRSTLDADAAATQVTTLGGTVQSGPMEVPGGDRIIVASDPLGVVFGVVGARQ